MPDQTTQPTVLVKKADGTTERITLAELKARQAGAKPVAVTPIVVPVVTPAIVEAAAVAPIVVAEKVLPIEIKIEPSKIIQPKIDKPLGLVIGPAEKKISAPSVLVQDQISQAPLKSADVKSLLNEEMPDSSHADMNTAPDRLDQVSKIIAGLSFKVPTQFENRLRSGVQLRVKDIRSEADTLDMCLRSIKDGGLGLTQPQAEELIVKTHPTVLTSTKKDVVSHAPVLPPIPMLEKIKKTEREAAVEKIIGQTPSSPAIADLIVPPKIAVSVPPSPNRSNSAQSFKPLMHDVQSKPSTMSPLDEIQYFSLVDLRRLSSQPSEAVSRLKQKFINLKDESFLLFIDSWNYWRNSPLYQSYLAVVDEALSQKLKLNTVLNTKEKISFLEIESLVKMEKELDI